MVPFRIKILREWATLSDWELALQGRAVPPSSEGARGSEGIGVGSGDRKGKEVGLEVIQVGSETWSRTLFTDMFTPNVSPG